MSKELTPLQVAEILGLSRKTVYAFIKDGRLPAIKRPGSREVHVSERDLKKFQMIDRKPGNPHKEAKARVAKRKKGKQTFA